jgi:hypothetical protein
MKVAAALQAFQKSFSDHSSIEPLLEPFLLLALKE